MKKTILIGVGVLLSGLANAQKLKESAVPPAVQSAFIKKFPNAKTVVWSKESETEFEAEFKNGALAQAANFETSGKWVVTETEIKKSDLPGAVAKAIEKDFAGYKIEESEKVEKPGTAAFYEVKVEKGEMAYDVQISAEGKVMKKEKEVEEKEGKKEKKD